MCLDKRALLFKRVDTLRHQPSKAAVRSPNTIEYVSSPPHLRCISPTRRIQQFFRLLIKGEGDGWHGGGMYGRVEWVECLGRLPPPSVAAPQAADSPLLIGGGRLNDERTTIVWPRRVGSRSACVPAPPSVPPCSPGRQIRMVDH